MLCQEHKLVGQIFAGPLILVLTFFFAKILCYGNLSCDTFEPALILAALLIGIIISLVGIFKGVSGIVKALKNREQSGIELKHLAIAFIVSFFVIFMLGATVFLDPIGPIYGPSQGDPTTVTSSKIKSLFSNLGAPQRTGIVIFKKDAPILAASSISKQTGAITPDQICLDLSSDIESSNAFERQESYVRYMGAQDYRSKIMVICDAGNKIDASINSSGVKDSFPNCTGNKNSTTMCFVSVVPSGP